VTAQTVLSAGSFNYEVFIVQTEVIVAPWLL